MRNEKETDENCEEMSLTNANVAEEIPPGESKGVKVSSVVRHSGDDVNVVADVNAVVTGNVGEGGTSTSRMVSRQSIVQRSSGKTGRSEQSSTVEVEDRDEE